VRLLYLTDRLSNRGGADHHLAQVIASSVEAGHEVMVAFGRDEGGVTGHDGVEYHRIRGLFSMVESSSRLGELADLLAAADVVHIQNVMNPTALAMAVDGGGAVVTVQDHRVFCPGQGKTLVDGSVCTAAMADAVCRDCIPDDAYRRATLELTRRRLAALRGAEVVVLSRYMADQLEVMGVAGARVIPPWVEVGPDRTIPGSFFLLGGRLVAHKGILDGWRAWQEANESLPLVIAGAGPLESKLLGTELCGWLTPEDLRAALRRARALIFPSGWQEPFGILGLEALAEGTPVIVAASGGTAGWSGDGCIRVRGGDVAAMAGAVCRLAGDADLALQLGREGQRAVARRFNRSQLEPKVLELYEELAAG